MQVISLNVGWPASPILSKYLKMTLVYSFEKRVLKTLAQPFQWMVPKNPKSLTHATIYNNFWCSFLSGNKKRDSKGWQGFKRPSFFSMGKGRATTGRRHYSQYVAEPGYDSWEAAPAIKPHLGWCCIFVASKPTWGYLKTALPGTWNRSNSQCRDYVLIHFENREAQFQFMVTLLIFF